MDESGRFLKEAKAQEKNRAGTGRWSANRVARCSHESRFPTAQDARWGILEQPARSKPLSRRAWVTRAPPADAMYNVSKVHSSRQCWFLGGRERIG